LHQFNPSISDADAERVATELYESTKGQKSKSKNLNGGRPFWRGGTESVVFNKLEATAEQDVPRTPVLACAITEALMRRYINKGGFMPSRINWVIQSSGVDYLHLLVVSMEYLIKRYSINARLSITVHDEIRYIVKDEDAYRAAMALQISNLWTRAMFSEQVGINDVPQVGFHFDNVTEANHRRKGVAFFSAVDVDKVLRKEVNVDCITPSHHIPIPHGESLDIYQLLSRSDASLATTTDNIL
jgi:DNA polymerase gamma 1